jgi:hypothetical protein
VCWLDNSCCSLTTKVTADFLGQFYSLDLGLGNLELISRFFEKYPEYVDKAFLNVKVGSFIFMNPTDRKLTPILRVE